MRLVRRVALAILTTGLFAVGLVDAVDSQSGVEPPQRGCLSFHQVHPEVPVHSALRNGVPTGFKIYLLRGSDQQDEGLVLRETPIVAGAELDDAQAGADRRTSEAALALRFNAIGTQKLAEFTRENVGRALAIIVDGRVVSAPLVREPILNGVAQISGTLPMADATELAAKMRAKTCSAAR